MKFIQTIMQVTVYNKNKCEFKFILKKCKQTAEIS